MSDFSSILPNNQKVFERDDKWRKIFEKYENCGDCEDDGYDIRDLIACGEVEDEELEDLFVNEDEAIESSDEHSNFKENDRELMAYSSKPKTLQDLERIYDPEFIQGLKRAFNKRCTELDEMNLTFWKRSKTHEGFNESNIRTPNFEASSRSFFRSSEQVCESGKKSSPNLFKMPHPRTFNGNNFQFGNFAQNMDQTSNFETSQQFPFQINDLMNGSQKINIRIREMHYDLSVDGRDITEFFIPNCNSTYKNAIPALGNLTINSTLNNAESLQKTEVLRPAIRYDVDVIRPESTQKVVETPELDLSNADSLNSSVIDNFEGINLSNSSREQYSSKAKKTSKRKTNRKKPKNRRHKSKHIDVKSESNHKETAIIDKLIPVSEKLELSYSDVVKLSPKNDLKQTKNIKTKYDSKNQIEPQKTRKNNHIVIDQDTSTEDLPSYEAAKEKSQKPKDLTVTESLVKSQENDKLKNRKKIKDEPQTSEKSKKSSKSKTLNKKAVELINNEIPNNNQVDSREKQKVQQKSKDIDKVKENKKEQQHKASSKTESKTTKELRSEKQRNESDLQYDKNGVPFRNIGGFIVHYEENDSDSNSSEDDTEFFRRIHAEIREKKNCKK